jgi:hypothetical protein
MLPIADWGASTVVEDGVGGGIWRDGGAGTALPPPPGSGGTARDGVPLVVDEVGGGGTPRAGRTGGPLDVVEGASVFLGGSVGTGLEGVVVTGLDDRPGGTGGTPRAGSVREGGGGTARPGAPPPPLLSLPPPGSGGGIGGSGTLEL